MKPTELEQTRNEIIYPVLNCITPGEDQDYCGECGRYVYMETECYINSRERNTSQLGELL